ncbi:MAG: SDR family NAD(P)-dependent oxidoreductase [Candidatus Binatus sp.]|uniref:SDR family NAD(P)-dependent oxidoreductase n=1 Tax=Candidatus Binatus sp. TaxID=2811406 RepID=UPI00271D356A|nr:SDR family NAD(P)-dependent oxidoreductase [Candidatus Binatus sp.]MDO8430980.1 SDR family NAD(P)-dependent oxidoreductase [Candidatus Binatus sp.]
MEIRGKVGVITGGGSGIGRATSERLAREGASIVVADLDEAGGIETVKRIEDAGGKAVFVRADVVKIEDTRRMFNTAITKFGRLDILHNNAGIGVGAPGFPDAPAERWHLVVEIDLQAVILGTGLAAPIMQKNGGGVIINTASMAGLYPHRQDAVYGAAKGGVVNFTHSLASWEAERKIRVNCICPGIVDTPLVRKGLEQAEKFGIKSWMPSKIIQPEEIADAVVMLVRDDSLFGCSLEVRPTGRQIVDPRPAPGARR